MATEAQERLGERLRSWLPETSGLVIDADSDGLLSAAALARACEVLGCAVPAVVGVYDNERLWLHDGVTAATELASLLWVDTDVRLPGARVISNHVLWGHGVPAPPSEVLNPNDLLEGDRQYNQKYPFSTFVWICWLLDLEPPGDDDVLAHGLLWAQDGGVRNIRDYSENCLRWALETLPESVLAPYAEPVQDPGTRQEAFRDIEDAASAAQDFVCAWVDTDGLGWRNYQWSFADRPSAKDRRLGRPGGVLADPASDHGRAMLAMVSYAFADIWPEALSPLEFSTMDAPYVGSWGSGPLGAAFNGTAPAPFSWARTASIRASWTVPTARYGNKAVADLRL